MPSVISPQPEGGLPRRHLYVLGLGLLLLVATGIGLRDPWPADEPRFALIARDMVATGDWLFPRVAGDLYADKPPLYFWLLAAGYALTHSIRASFLVPSLLAGAGILALTYDLGRRLVDRPAAFLAAGTLLASVQFLTVARSAQIDATLCFFCTLSLYGVLRHLLWGPGWGWLFTGGIAAGLGIITKGVGFLPLLILIPYGVLRLRGFEPLPRFAGGLRWGILPAGLLLGVSPWLLPMLTAVAGSQDPALLAYRNEILFHQTVSRYAASWQHAQPWYYFVVEVIPALWFPFSLLLVWLVPRFAASVRARHAVTILLLSWICLCLCFFSATPGKRGIYVFPLLPALAVASAPFLAEILRTPRLWRAARLWAGLLVVLALGFSYAVIPVINGERSGRTFTRAMLRQVRADQPLALLQAKEQFFLYLDRPVINFGHGRWMEGQAESDDAARWLNAAPNRVLLLPGSVRAPCFAQAPQTGVGTASREQWFLATGSAASDCASQGDPARTILYRPAGR